jgi:hypothetical protein
VKSLKSAQLLSFQISEREGGDRHGERERERQRERETEREREREN